MDTNKADLVSPVPSDGAKTALLWVPVSERTPRVDEDVLTFGKDGVRVAMWDPVEYWFTPTGYALRGVTHWMPLPAPPTGSAA